ncbi:MAG: sigma factor-like helix-turn-helix DNA-binding protein [Phycisphaerales bacterium JB064]
MARRGPTSQAAIDALAELKRAPRRVVIRAIERLEAGIAALDTETEVPAGWFLSTASGYASERRGRVPGDIALADTAALIESLSGSIDLRADELPEGCVGVKELASAWSVAERTLHRYRAKGLAARSVRSGRTRRLVFSPCVVEAYQRRAGKKLGEAKHFTRMSEEQRSQALSHVDALLAKGETISTATQSVAKDMGRSPEAIRQLVLKREGDRESWTSRDRKLALRAHDRFIEPSTIAERLGHDATATRRMIDAQRLERLRAMDIEAMELPEPTPPRLPLGAPGPTVLADLVAEMRDTSAPDRATERTLTAYARFLTSRAARTIAEARAATLRAEPIDAAETDLLWAARLRVEALRPLLGFVLRGIEARLGSEIEALPARVAATRLQLALAAAAEAAHRYDPGRGGRLSAAVTIAVDRVATETPAGTAKASGARRSFAQSRIDDWTRRVSPWQGSLDAPALLRSGLHTLPEEQRSLLEARYGFGERPHTLAELSESFGIHRPWVARRVREAARAAMEAGRRARDGRAADTIGP